MQPLQTIQFNHLAPIWYDAVHSPKPRSLSSVQVQVAWERRVTEKDGRIEALPAAAWCRRLLESIVNRQRRRSTVVLASQHVSRYVLLRIERLGRS